MTSKQSELLQQSFKPIFKDEGFKKTGGRWHFYGDDLIKIFGIQRSNFSAKHYFNIGLYFKSAGDVIKPYETAHHVRLRLEQLLPSKDEILKFYDLSDLGTGEDVPVKIERITELVKTYAVPWFLKYNSMSDIVKADELKPHYWNLAAEEIAKVEG